MSSRRTRSKGKHRGRARRFSQARVHGEICSYCSQTKSKRAGRKAPRISDWPASAAA